MTREIEWTQDQRDRIKALQDGDLDARSIHTDGTTKTPVPPHECRRWRTTLRKNPNYSIKDIQADYGLTAVESHAKGECSHSHSRVGVPVRYAKHQTQWVPERMISAGSKLSNLDVFHTRECVAYPDSVVVLGGWDFERYSWRECRHCRGVVPEARPIGNEDG